MSYDKAPQIVGMRFTDVTCPAGYDVTDAYVQFQVDEARSSATTLTIHGHLIGDAPRLTSSTGDLSNRQKTSKSIEWNPPAWSSVGQAGPDQRTPNMAEVIEEIFGVDGWSSGNALVILVTGQSASKNESHIAESFDGDSAGAPFLHVECGGGATTTTASSTTSTSTTTTLPPTTTTLPPTTTTRPPTTTTSTTSTTTTLPPTTTTAVERLRRRISR